MVANFFYVFYRADRGRLWKMLLAMFMTFMSLSTGPNLAQLVQLMLIAWERLFRFFPPKWFLLVVFGGTVLGIDAARLSRRRSIAFVIEHLRLQPADRLGPASRSSSTAAPRCCAAPALRHRPLRDWGAPWWRPVVGRQLLAGDGDALRAAGARLHVARASRWHAVRMMARRGLGRGGGELPQGLPDRAGGAVLRARHRAYLGRGQRLHHVLSRRRRLDLLRRGAGARAAARAAAGARPPTGAAEAAAPSDARGRRRKTGPRRGRRRNDKAEVGVERMITTFRMLMDLLTPRERRGFYILAVIMLLVAHLRDRRRRLDPAVHGGAGRARQDPAQRASGGALQRARTSPAPPASWCSSASAPS